VSAARRSVLAAGTIAAVAAGLLRIGRRSGVDCDEARAPLPGDAIVPRPDWQSTRGITIAAPTADVWPWIVQMGYPAFRAGWYTPYWLDRLQWGISQHSSETIVPALQALAVGDTVPDSPDYSTYFTVVTVDPARALVLHSTRHLMRPFTRLSFSWAFVLTAVDDRTTRLLMRARVATEPWWARPVLWLLIGPGDFLNASVMLRGIRRRAQSAARA
jgi:hypothetical protein